MPRLLALALTAFFSFIFSTFSANAAVVNSLTRLYFNENEQLVGQSILYCANNNEHAGTTAGPTIVTISYSCATGELVNIGYYQASQNLRETFCDTYGSNGLCDSGVMRSNYLPGPWSTGLYN
jgi:hypothetical protein